MQFGLNPADRERVDRLAIALDNQAKSADRLAAAIEAHTHLLSDAHNGPRG